MIRSYLANKQHKTFLDHWLLEDDLSGYRHPWAYARLNTVERILLSRRLKNEAGFTQQFVGDQVALLKHDLDRVQFLFESGLGSSSLDVGGAVDFDAAVQEQLKSRLKRLTADGAITALETLADSVTLGRSMSRKRLSELTEDSAPDGEFESGERFRREAGKKAAVKRPDFSLELREKEKDGRANAADDLAADMPENFAFFKGDTERRELSRRLYEKLDKTQEWAENNYYHIPIV